MQIAVASTQPSTLPDLIQSHKASSSEKLLVMPSRDGQTPAIIPIPNALTRCHCLPSLPHSGIHFAQRQVAEDPPPPPPLPLPAGPVAESSNPA